MHNREFLDQVVDQIHEQVGPSAEMLRTLPLFWLVVIHQGARNQKHHYEHPEILSSVRNTPFHEVGKSSMRLWAKLAEYWIRKDNPALYDSAINNIRFFALLPVGLGIANALSLATKGNVRLEFLESLNDPRFWPQAMNLANYNTRDELYWECVVKSSSEWWKVLTRNIHPLSKEDMNIYSKKERAINKRKGGDIAKDALTTYWLSHVLWKKSYAEILECLNDDLASGSSGDHYERDIDKIRQAINRLPLKHSASTI